MLLLSCFLLPETLFKLVHLNMFWKFTALRYAYTYEANLEIKLMSNWPFYLY